MLPEEESTRISKFLSLVLRHQPEAIGLALDGNGWVLVSELLEKMQRGNMTIDTGILQHVVATNNKKRFAFNDDQTRIRASQGHSIDIDLGYPPAVPPAILYHGTAVKNLASIMQNGLLKQSRQQVHLSADKETALKVGQRHGKPVVLEVAAASMQNAGFAFFLSANGVWLTDSVPAAYLQLHEKANG